MKIVVIADEQLKAELLSQRGVTGKPVDWLTQLPDHTDAGCIIDLLFTPDKERVEKLRQCSAPLVIINEVVHTLSEFPSHFARINGWPLFLQRAVVEASGKKEVQEQAEDVMHFFNKKIEWLPDTPGFITARVVSMIINEAYFTLEEGVSTKEEIDTAMKLGTNYPYGPFEWFEKTGGKKFLALLTVLAKTNSRFQPAALLTKEVIAE